MVSTVSGFAQKRQNIYFLNSKGKEVSVKDSAEFIRVITEIDSSSENYQLQEYCKNGLRKRIGYVSHFEDHLILEGYVTEFYPNGNRKKITEYVKNDPTGESITYFENGILQEKRIYITPVRARDGTVKYDYLVQYLADSLGQPFLDSAGTGNFKTVSDSSVITKGAYLKGIKNGRWEIYSPIDSSTVQYIFQGGEFITGTRTEKNGLVTKFNDTIVHPKFPGGDDEFHNFCRQKMRHFLMIRREEIQGKVILQFHVERDGSLSGIKILRGIGGGCEEEAVRVLKLSAK